MKGDRRPAASPEACRGRTAGSDRRRRRRVRSAGGHRCCRGRAAPRPRARGASAAPTTPPPPAPSSRSSACHPGCPHRDRSGRPRRSSPGARGDSGVRAAAPPASSTACRFGLPNIPSSHAMWPKPDVGYFLRPPLSAVGAVSRASAGWPPGRRRARLPPGSSAGRLPSRGRRGWRPRRAVPAAGG